MMKRMVLTVVAMAGLAPLAFGQLSDADKAFAKEAARANNFEIKAAQMVPNMTKNSAYDSFAQMMISDHTSAGQGLGTAVTAADPSAQLPTDITADSQAKLDVLEHAGKDFDVKYRDQMISSHMATLKLFQNYDGLPSSNPQLKQFAEKMIPAFQKHLAEAKKLPKQ